MALGALVAVGALLVDVGDPVDVVDTMQRADWGWLALAIVVAFAANVAYAVALQGTVRTRLPLGPTTELQVAMSFSNLAVPAIGGQGMQVRFLQRLGVDLPSAVAAGGVLSGFGVLVAAFGCFGVALVVEPAHVDLSLIPTNGLLLLLVVLAVLLVLCRVRDRGIVPHQPVGPEPQLALEPEPWRPVVEAQLAVGAVIVAGDAGVGLLQSFDLEVGRTHVRRGYLHRPPERQTRHAGPGACWCTPTPRGRRRGSRRARARARRRPATDRRVLAEQSLPLAGCRPAPHSALLGQPVLVDLDGVVHRPGLAGLDRRGVAVDHVTRRGVPEEDALEAVLVVDVAPRRGQGEVANRMAHGPASSRRRMWAGGPPVATATPASTRASAVARRSAVSGCTRNLRLRRSRSVPVSDIGEREERA